MNDLIRYAIYTFVFVIPILLPTAATGQLVIYLTKDFQWAQWEEEKECQRKDGSVVEDCKKYTVYLGTNNKVNPPFSYVLDLSEVAPRGLVNVILIDWDSEQAVEVVDRGKKKRDWIVQLNENKRYYELWKKRPEKIAGGLYVLRWKLLGSEDLLPCESELFQLKVVPE